MDVTIEETELEALRTRAALADSAATDAAAAREALTAGLTRYRETVAAANPTIPAEAIHGDSFEAVDAAATSARAIAEAAVAAAAATTTPPAVPVVPTVPAGGAPVRDNVPDTSDMSPAKKIAYGLTLAQRK